MSFADIEFPNSGLFLKIVPGKPSVIRLLQADPVARYVHGFGKTEVACQGAGCAGCMNPDKEFKAKHRYKMNVYSHDTQKVLIFDFPKTLCQTFQSVERTLASQGLKIMDVDLVVEGSGEKMQRKYQVTPMIKSKEVPAGLSLHDLSGLPF